VSFGQRRILLLLHVSLLCEFSHAVFHFFQLLQSDRLERHNFWLAKHLHSAMRVLVLHKYRGTPVREGSAAAYLGQLAFLGDHKSGFRKDFLKPL
jgi:hypothetical protein